MEPSLVSLVAAVLAQITGERRNRAFAPGAYRRLRRPGATTRQPGGCHEVL